MTRHLRIAAVALFAALVLTSCAESDAGSGSDGRRQRQGPARVLQGLTTTWRRRSRSSKTDRHQVEFLTGNDAELLERIAAEPRHRGRRVPHRRRRQPRQRRQGRALQPMDSPKLKKVIPAQYRDPDDLWYGLALRPHDHLQHRRPQRGRGPEGLRGPGQAPSGRARSACATPPTTTSSRWLPT